MLKIFQVFIKSLITGSDGIVNVLDVITVVNYVIGALEDLSFDELCAADNNNDGIVNVLDIVAIVNTILDN